jgi:hypothetical protein
VVVCFCGLVLFLASIIQWADWNRYRDAVAQQISEAIDRPVSIDQGLSARLFPSVRLEVRGLVVGNPAGNYQEHFLTVENVRFELDMGALAGGRLLIREILLERPTLQLEIDPNGSPNWEPDRGPVVPVLPLPVSRVSVVDGSLTYGSGAEADPWEIRVDTLVYVLPREGQNQKGQISGQLSYAGDAIEVSGALGSLNGLVSDQLAPVNLTFVGNGVSGSVSGAVNNLRTASNADLYLEVSTGRLERNLTDLLPGLPWQNDAIFSGTVNATGHLVGSPGRDLRLESVRLSTTAQPLNFTAQGDLDLVPANVRRNRSIGELRLQMKNQSLQELAALMSLDVLTDVRVSGQGILSGQPGDFHLGQIMLIGESPRLGIQLTGNVSHLGLADGPDLALNIEATSDKLTELLRQFKLEVPLSGSAQVTGALHGNYKGYRLSDLSASFDTTDLTLEGTGQFDLLQNSFEGQFGFTARTGSVRSLADSLGRQFPVDATARANGVLTCANSSCGIEIVNVAINSPQLEVSGSGRVDGLDEQLQLALNFEGHTEDIAVLAQAWGIQWPIPPQLGASVTGWFDFDGNEARLSGLVGQISGDGLSGRFTGSLINLMHTPRPMWDLNLDVAELGRLIEHYGGPGDYHEPAQIQLQVRPSSKRALPLRVQGELLTKSLAAQFAGEFETFDDKTGFSASFVLTAEGPHELRQITGVGLPPMGRLQVTGEFSRATDTHESIKGSVNLQSEKLGQLTAEGVWGEQWKIGSQLELKFEVDRLSKVSALLPVSLQGDMPLQAQATVRTDGETLLVTELKVKLGRNNISGEISYSLNVADSHRQKIDGRLASEYFNLNDLFPKKEKKYLFGNEEIPLVWADRYDVDLEFATDHLLRRNYEVTDFTLKVNSLNGLVNFQLQGISAGGDLEVQLDLDTRVDPPPANYFYDWKHLDLDLLPPQLKGGLDVSGVLSTQGYLAGVGRSLHEIAGSGNGYLFTELEKNIKFPRGREEFLATTPLNIVEQILRGVSPWAERKKYYDIKCGVIGMQITDGVGHSAAPPDHTIALKAKEFELSAFGDLELSEEDLELSVRSKPRRERMSLDSLLDQSGLSLLYPPYYRISGNLRRPTVVPDPEGRNLLERLKFEDSGLKLGAAWATGGASIVVLSLLNQLDDEGGGCEGAKERSRLFMVKAAE